MAIEFVLSDGSTITQVGIEKLKAEHKEMLNELKSLYRPPADGVLAGVVWLGDFIKRIDPNYIDPWKTLAAESEDPTEIF